MQPRPKITPRPPENEIPLIDWSWHKRRLDLTLACATFYLLPLAWMIFLPAERGRMIVVAAAILTGLVLATPNRRWLDGAVLALALWPDDGWRFLVWLVGFVVTCYADGALKNKPVEPEKGEWD